MNPRRLKSSITNQVVLGAVLAGVVFCVWTLPPLYKRFRIHAELQSAEKRLKKQRRLHEARMALLNVKKDALYTKLKELTLMEEMKKGPAKSFDQVHNALRDAAERKELQGQLVGTPTFERGKEGKKEGSAKRFVTFSFRMQGKFQAFFRFLQNAVRNPSVTGVPAVSVKTKRGEQTFRVRIRAVLR